MRSSQRGRRRRRERRSERKRKRKREANEEMKEHSGCAPDRTRTFYIENVLGEAWREMERCGENTEPQCGRNKTRAHILMTMYISAAL